MRTLASTLMVAMDGWKSAGGQLLASGVILLSAYPRYRVKCRRQRMPRVLYGHSLRHLRSGYAIRENLSGPAAICVVSLL